MANVFEKIWEKSGDTLNSNEKLKQLIQDVSKKVGGSSEGEYEGLFAKVKLLLEMLRAHLKGTYKSFSGNTILLFVFGLVYFLTPVDLIPDFLPALGFVDDLSLLYWVFKNVNKDIEDYLDWKERSQ